MPLRSRGRRASSGARARRRPLGLGDPAAAIARGLEHHRAGQLAAASKCYWSVLVTRPRHPDALHLLGVVAHQQGDHARAIELIGCSIDTDPSQPSPHSNLGLALHALGRFAEAEQSYHRALELAPGFAEAHGNLGVTLQELGRLDDALASYDRALGLRADLADAHRNRGVVLQHLGRPGDAESAYRSALALRPDDTDALNNLGAVLLGQRRVVESIECLERAIALSPGHTQALTNLASALTAAGQPGTAIASLERALEVAPTRAELHNALGHVRHEGGELAEAVGSFLRAIVLRPDYAEAHNNLGATLKELGHLDDAMQSYARALAIDPRLAQSHNNIGVVLREQGRFAESIAAYERALAIQPGFAEAHANLGNTLTDQARFDEAVDRYRRALDGGFQHPDLYANLGNALRNQGLLDAARESYRRAQALAYDPAREIALAMMQPVIAESTDAIHDSRARLAEDVTRLRREGLALPSFDRPIVPPNFYLAYHGLDDRSLQRAMADLYLSACPELAWSAPECAERPRRADGRIRVGFASRYLQGHTIGKLMRGFIERLSRDRFEVVVLHVGGELDEMARAIDGAADHVIRVPRRLGDARAEIAAASLDVLVYPEIGMDPITYFLAYARLAPVQCVMWGHPVTTGIPNVDYFVSSALLEPDGAAAHYSEQLVMLDRMPTCYQRPLVPDGARDRARLGLDRDATLYVCPQSLFKLHPDFDATLGAILRRDPRGRLVLLEGLSRHWERLLRERFARAIPDVADRVDVIPRLDLGGFLDLLRTADAVLDPWGWTGGNSTYEAFALGVPVVTRPSAFMRGRVTAGAYRQIGVMDCVATTDAEYVDLAVRLANDPVWRADVGARIVARHDALYDDAAAVRELERFLEHAATGAGR